jgi:hypothetical protein
LAFQQIKKTKNQKTKLLCFFRFFKKTNKTMVFKMDVTSPGQLSSRRNACPPESLYNFKSETFWLRTSQRTSNLATNLSSACGATLKYDVSPRPLALPGGFLRAFHIPYIYLVF